MPQVAGGTIVILGWTNCGANCVSTGPSFTTFDSPLRLLFISFAFSPVHTLQFLHPLPYFSSSLTPAWARVVNSLAPVFLLCSILRSTFLKIHFVTTPCTSNQNPQWFLNACGRKSQCLWRCRFSILLHNLCPFVVFRPLNLITLFFFFSVFPFHWKWVIH